MKISIITVSLNSEATIAGCLGSVQKQTHPDLEHLIIDGGSKDRTVDIARSSPRVTTVVTERDRGLYDAMNKGLARCTGEVVGILNSDDYYPNERVLSHVAHAFENPGVDATIGDIAFVNAGDLKTITRYCSARNWRPELFRWGIMPPHPAFFVRRRHYEQLGNYRTDLKISADFDLLVRFLHGARLKCTYLGEPLVFMRAGGASNANWRSRLRLNRETLQACRENGIRTNALMLASRYIWKVWEFLPGLRR